jgi:hypothetical protein
MRSDDEETAQTVSYMEELAAADSNDRAVIAATKEALDQAGIDQTAAPLEKAHAVYWWLKRTVRYVATPGTSPLVDQTLISPCAVLAMPEPIGDCPQFSMLAAAMFRVLCQDSLFVTIAAEPAFPNQWSHIYNTVEVYPGQYMPFDASNGPAPGAEYSRAFKRRVWPRLTPGKCRTKEGAKEMIRSTQTPRSGMRNSVTRRALRGTLGQDPSLDIYAGDPSIGIPAIAPPDYSALDTSLAASTDVMMPPATPAGTPWYSTLLTDLSQAATPLLRSQTTAPPRFITSPSGQSILYNPNTGTIISSGTSLSSAINPTYIVIGLAAIAALAFVGKK